MFFYPDASRRKMHEITDYSCYSGDMRLNRRHTGVRARRVHRLSAGVAKGVPIVSGLLLSNAAKARNINRFAG